MIQWLASAVSIQGTSHDISGDLCQDHSIARRFGEAYILVLSDGAGSCKYSRNGARAACIGFIRSARQLLNPYLSDAPALEDFLEGSTKDDWRFAVEGARELIERMAIHHGHDAHSEMACTLLAAVIGRDAAIVLQVGDGAWVSEREESQFSCETWPENGEYTNETFFVTQADWVEHMQFSVIRRSEGLRALVGFSDGVERLCIDFRTRAPVAGFFGPLSALRQTATRKNFETSLRSFLVSERVTAITDDDCSVVAVCRESI